MPDFEISIKVIGTKTVRVTADDKDKAYALVNAQALEHVTPLRAPIATADFSWKGVMSLSSPEWQCQCGRVLDYECDRCAHCGHVEKDGAAFINDYEAETFECPECGHVNCPADGDCSGCPDCGADANEAMTFKAGDKRITFSTEESLRQRAEAAEAARDVLAKLVASGCFDCPGHDGDCPYGENGDDCRCDSTAMGSDMKCWADWAHQQARQED